MLLWLILLAIWCSCSDLAYGADREYHRLCIVDDRSQYRPGEGQFTPEDITDVTMCTHLLYNYALVDSNGTGLEVSGEYEEGNYQVISSLKGDSPDLKTLLGIGGPRGSDGFYDIVNSTDTVAMFAENVVRFARDRNFDGVVLDWIQDGETEDLQNLLEGFDLLLYELSNTFQTESTETGNPPLLFGVILAGDRDSIDAFYPLESIAAYADLVLVKGYDLYTPEVPLIGHQSALFPRDEEEGYLALLNVDFTVRYLLYSGIPPSKLLLGIPSHGRSQRFINESLQFFGADSNGQGSAGPYSQYQGRLAFFEICQLLGNGWSESFHEGHQVPFAFNNEEIVTYDNTDSISLKINLVKDSQLGGVFISSLGDDDFSGLFCNQGKFPLTTSLRGFFQRSRDKCYPGEYGSKDLPGCTPCILGQYQPDFYQTQCLPCPKGETTLKPGAIDSSECLVDCPSGSEYSFYTKECTVCPMGFHRKAGIQAHCLKCPNGQTTVSRASSHCVDKPDSVNEVPENRVNVDATLLFRVTSCENKPVIIGIISQMLKEFVFDLSSSWSDICTSNCSNVQFSTIKECVVRRQKRSEPRIDDLPHSNRNTIEVAVTMTNVSQDIINSQHTRRVDKVLAEAFDETTLFTPLDVYGVQYLGLKHLETNIVCSNGSAAVNKMKCHPCPVGTFHNVTSSMCDACPVGTYQDEEGMTSCLQCDGTKNTMTSGSVSPNDCISPCQAKPSFCYNSGQCHWNEGDPTSIYCQCADGYVGERCENTKAYYMDSGAIVGTSIGAVSAFLILCLIILACVVCTRYRNVRTRSVDVMKKDARLYSRHGNSSLSGRGHSQSLAKGSRFDDYLDYHSWLYPGQHQHQLQHQARHQDMMFSRGSREQRQQYLHQGSRKVSRHRSMPSSTPFNVYGMPYSITSGRDNTTFPRTSKCNSPKSVIGEY